MYTASAELYDLIHSAFKDYAAEADMLAALIRSENPGARRILDVACGTGEHARLLTERHGFSVDGLDLDPSFVAIAQRKLQDASVFQADMTEFSVSREYDAVVCLFSAIGYARTIEKLTHAFQCFRAHLSEGGLVLIEPWFAPGAMEDGHYSLRTAQSDELAVCRLGRTEIAGRLSRLHIEYLVGTAAGIDHLSEVHELGLFTLEEMTRCFVEAGLQARYDPVGPYGRGLFVARAVA